MTELFALALLCPVCARDNGPGALVLLGAFILLPFGVTALVVRAIRRASRPHTDELEP
ncbi:MAG TPA: hypothetical protein VKN99_07520 [Polyangia bacterium]|nr:hypothetical protein [Polyangia bacterium]